jgi:hypothetical protein
MEYQCDRGDHAILFRDSPEYSEVTDPQTADLRIFWERLKHRDPLCIPHFHYPGTLPEGEWYRPDDPGLDPVIEVFSCHGRYDTLPFPGMALAPPLVKALRADRNGDAFLKRGFRYGIVCNSDGHKGRPGSNGLTAVFARDLSRNAIFEALRARRCYGTTNARILLVFNANGYPMGSEIPFAPKVELDIRVIGTDKLRYVDVLKDGMPFRRFRPEGRKFHDTLSDSHGEQTTFYQVKVLQEDMEMAFGSPVWVEGE